ncbi:general substrate transporter [Macrophomina phaseolina]|uniref:General substrate transporter n=1 Tax=Macrophomina phaseolina TaxID=35725 RepID=A0ABQ8FTA5_9PEZI|nr:general substrate transporter [Macrophomina phaseolina]
MPADATLNNLRVGWFQNWSIVRLNLILLLSMISSYATGFDGSMMNGLQSLETWQEFFHYPGPSLLGLLNAIQNVGQLVALPLCAIACDRYGRRTTLLGGAFLMLIGVALQGGAQSTGMFIAARGLLGFGLAFNITAAPLLILELAYPSQRAPLVSIYNSLYSVGAVSAAWITFGTFRMASSWAWRVPSILQALSSILQLLLCWRIEESPRWLIAKDRIEQAQDLITKYHAAGNPEDPVVSLEMAEIREALRLEAEAAQSTNYLTFFKTKGNRHRLLIVMAVGFFSQWSGNGLISYYLTLILDSIGYKSEAMQTLINALLQLWSLFWGIVFALLVNQFGRRTLFLVSTAGILLVYIVWTALEATYEKQTDLSGEGSHSVAKGVLAMIFLYNFFFSIGWGPLQVTYVVEILPYSLRARGLVLYNLSVALALIFNQYVNPVGVTNSKWMYYITYDLVVVFFLFVETGGKSLEETAALLDGEEAAIKIEESGEQAAKEVAAHVLHEKSSSSQA